MTEPNSETIWIGQAVYGSLEAKNVNLNDGFDCNLYGYYFGFPVRLLAYKLKSIEPSNIDVRDVQYKYNKVHVKCTKGWRMSFLSHAFTLKTIIRNDDFPVRVSFSDDSISLSLANDNIEHEKTLFTLQSISGGKSIPMNLHETGGIVQLDHSYYYDIIEIKQNHKSNVIFRDSWLDLLLQRLDTIDFYSDNCKNETSLLQLLMNKSNNWKVKNGILKYFKNSENFKISFKTRGNSYTTLLPSYTAKQNVDIDELLPNDQTNEPQLELSQLHFDAYHGVAVISNGAIIDSKDEDSNTPLIYASKNGHANVVELYLKNQANVNAANIKLWTALHVAAYNGHLEVVELLLMYNAIVDARKLDQSTPLHLAAGNGHVEIVRLLLDNNAAIDAVNAYNWTSLHLAVRNGHVKVVELLLEKGANVEAEGEKLWKPLHIAACNGIPEIVELLLQYGANVDSKTENLWTPLHLSAEKGHEKVVELLLNNQADADAVTEKKWTPLHISTKNGHERVVKLLIRKSKLNAEDRKKWTPLHIAAYNGNSDIAALLLFSNSSVDPKEKDNWTPLHLAAEEGHEKVVDLLLKQNADFDAEIENKWTALTLAAMKGFENVVALLRKKEAQV